MSDDAPPAEGAGLADSGDDAARRLLARAKRSAPARKARRPRRVAPDEQRWSGPADDVRDPARLGATIGDLVRERSWEATLRDAGILARWEQIVGAEVAAHCRPERLDDRVLTCVAESTAWATQLRLLAPRLLDRIRADLGTGVVDRLRVRGPSGPDWRHGPLRVTGRGPRDTYG